MFAWFYRRQPLKLNSAFCKHRYSTTFIYFSTQYKNNTRGQFIRSCHVLLYDAFIMHYLCLSCISCAFTSFPHFYFHFFKLRFVSIWLLLFISKFFYFNIIKLTSEKKCINIMYIYMYRTCSIFFFIDLTCKHVPILHVIL